MIDVTTFVIAAYMLACRGAILFTVIMLYFHRLYGRRSLLFWAMSWLALGVYLLGGTFAAIIPEPVQRRTPCSCSVLSSP